MIPIARDDTTAEFFDGTAGGRFLIRRCEPDGHASRSTARQCTTCGSPELRWDESSGRAALVSWAVAPAKVGEATVTAIVELEEGPWWWTKLVGVDPATLQEGTPLKVAFLHAEGSEAAPVFEPA